MAKVTRTNLGFFKLKISNTKITNSVISELKVTYVYPG